MEMQYTRKQQWILVLALALMLGTGIVAKAQTAEQVLTEVEGAIRAGDAAKLSTHFHATVEVTIGDKDAVYAANQARYVLQEFFEKNKVSSFSIPYKATSEGTYYAVGAYVTTTGVNYDTNIFLKKNDGRYVIEQIRFDTSF